MEANLVLVFLFIYLIAGAIALMILHAVIKSAVSAALEQHYKMVRWYEATGEWAGKRPPRALDAGPVNSKR